MGLGVIGIKQWDWVLWASSHGAGCYGHQVIGLGVIGIKS